MSRQEPWMKSALEEAVEAERDRAVALCNMHSRHLDEAAAEQYGKGREADGNRYETAAEAVRDVAKWIGRGCVATDE